MHLPETRIEHLHSFGYSEDEARFLYLVTTHSGYFSTRQYLQFAGAKSGEKSFAFTQKVLGKGHATARLLLRNGRVYHLFSRQVYRAMGRENLRNPREHSAEHIRAKLAILDFVLAHLDYCYLETEAEKVAYFCRNLGISRALLPAKRYSGAIRQKTTDRYFVDKFPLFFPPESPPALVVTFSFVDPGLLTLDSFETHLLAYATLFSALPSLRFVYIATCPTHLEAARKLFLTMVNRAPNTDPGEEILRYFTVRKLWESKQYGQLNNDDIEFLNRALKRFDDAPTDIRYHQWAGGRVSSDMVRAEFRDRAPKQEVSFRTELVDGQAALFESRHAPRSRRICEGAVNKTLPASFGSVFKPAFGAEAQQAEEN
jgi:hypothetical protein